MIHLFITNIQLFNSQEVNWWTEVMLFLPAGWTLILTAPIHCRGPLGEQVIETHIHLGRPEGVNFQQIYIFGLTIPLTMDYQ